MRQYSLISNKQFHRLVDRCDDKLTRALIWCSYVGACRTAELANALSSGFNRQQGYITVVRKKQNRESKVWLPEKAVSAVAAVYDEKSKYLFGGISKSATQRRLAQSSAYINKRVSNLILRKSALNHISTIGTVADAAAITGHRSVETTINSYIQSEKAKHYKSILDKL